MGICSSVRIVKVCQPFLSQTTPVLDFEAVRDTVGEDDNNLSSFPGRIMKKANSETPTKLLLLGAGQSGKSTFLKQIKILKDNFYEKQEERMDFLGIVNSNLLESMNAILVSMPHLGLTISNPLIAKDQMEFSHFYENYLQLKTMYDKRRLPVTMGLSIDRLWRNEDVQNTYKMAHTFQLNETAEYFFESALRICRSDYIPTKSDIIHTRVCTTGITEYTFRDKINTFTIIDVGGQRSQRLKWLSLFDGADGVIFFASASGYNLVLEEDGETNRMLEALRLFFTLTSSPLFSKTPIILFLNKIDLFLKKLEHFPLSICFKEYPGPNKFEPAIQFIENRFRAHNSRNHHRGPAKTTSSYSQPKNYIPDAGDQSLLYVHRTCATDTKQIEFVFKATSDFVLESYLKHIALA